MSFTKKLMYAICGLLLSTTVMADFKAQVIYQPPSRIEEAVVAKQLHLSGAVESVIQFVNEHIRLSETLHIIIGGQDGPLYDPTNHTIFLPYGFIDEVKARFEHVNYAQTGVSIHDATMDVVMHTLFHELAHAFIDRYQLPVLGKEEDAADALASVLLIEYFEGGAEIVVSAADLFELEDRDIDAFDEQDFWGEHSLDVQRYYASLCHVYGSDPVTYQTLKTELGLSQERAAGCVEEYEVIATSWLTLLSPYWQARHSSDERDE